MKKKLRKNILPTMAMVGPVTLWLILFVAVPLIYVIFMTFCSLDENYNLVFSFTLDNYKRLFDTNYVQIYGQSLLIAFVTTVICIGLAYPFAFLIARVFTKKKVILYMMVIIPFWTNSLIRIYGWRTFLSTNGWLAQLISQDMVAELDKEALTNLSNIGTAYLNPSYDQDNTYSVPYQGGVAAIAVNTEKVDIEINSYEDLFNPSLANSIVVLDDFRAIIGMTARSMGYSMNETDLDRLEEIKNKLLTIKPNIKLYDSDSPKSALIAGDCSVAMIWNAEIALSMEENSDIKIVFPEEGAYVFMDNWCVTKESPNYDNAMKFINFMLDSEVAQMVSEEFPYLNPNTVAVEAMGEEYSENPAKNPPEDVISKGEYVENLDVDTLAIYDQMWTELKK